MPSQSKAVIFVDYYSSNYRKKYYHQTFEKTNKKVTELDIAKYSTTLGLDKGCVFWFTKGE
jgi:hypothetical protein